VGDPLDDPVDAAPDDPLVEPPEEPLVDPLVDPPEEPPIVASALPASSGVAPPSTAPDWIERSAQ